MHQSVMFDSQSGHRAGLASLVSSQGACGRQSTSVSLSHRSLSLSVCVSVSLSLKLVTMSLDED